jgi:DNA-binding NarL/FixJ family response regulator
MNSSFVVVQIEGFADVSKYRNKYPNSMDKKITTVLIVTRSTPLAEGLHALLTAIPQIETAQVSRTFEDACQQVEANRIQIVLIDFILLGNHPTTALEKIQKLSPETQRVLLVDGVQEVNLMPKYAEAILIKGISPSALTTIVTNLLSEKGDTHEHNDSD